MAIEYNFKYMPLVGKLSGKSMAEQTETAINEIAKIVNDNTAQAEIINTLAEEANTNSVEALEKANEALETSGRVYIKETGAVDLDSYCESQLIYINNVFSQNLPVESKGFLEVKTNDDKTQATQVFVDDLNKKIYTRSGAITETQVGAITTYIASYGAWNKFDYLPLSGGTMTSYITFSSSTSLQIRREDTSGFLIISGGNAYNNSAVLRLYGKDATTRAGEFLLYAADNSNSKLLNGTPGGSLTWGGYNVITSALTGNILSATGTVEADGTTQVDICTINDHEAGIWLILAIVDLTSSVNFNYSFSIANAGATVRNISGAGGGGMTACNILSLTKDSTITVRGWLSTSPATNPNIRATLKMVRLA